MRSVFDYKKITGKINLMALVILMAFAILLLVFYTQNSSMLTSLKTIQDLRVPFPIVTSDLVSGANRVAASQRAFLMTGEDRFRQERIDIWRTQMEPSMTELERLEPLLDSQKKRDTVRVALEKIRQYREEQEATDRFFLENREAAAFGYERLDTAASRSQLVESLKVKAGFDKEINGRVTGQASALRKEIRELLLPLNNSQEVALRADVEGATASINRTNLIAVVVALGAALAILGVLIAVARAFGQAVAEPTGFLAKLARGIMPDALEAASHELNPIVQSGNVLLGNLRKASGFALEIGEGKYDHVFEAAGKDDVLGNSLLQMREKLRYVSQEDKRRNWISEGLAHFSQISRTYDNLATLSDTIISGLVKYLGVNQGWLYIVNNENPENAELELVACYAWDRKKHLQKRISLGEGLAGQVWQEGEGVCLTSLPADYLKITSGCGEANPCCLLIQPLKVSDNIYGIIELVSFQPLEAHHREFVEKVSENIASIIAGAKTQERTQNLLQASQQFAEELRAQEEEIRQNMEELTTTQEEMARKEAESVSIMVAIDNSMAYIEFDLQGNILNANALFLHATGYVLGEIQGKHHRIFIDPAQANSREYLQFWADLRAGIIQQGEFCRFGKGRKEVWLSASYTPVLNQNGEVCKIIKIARDITDLKRQPLESADAQNA